MSIMLVSRLIVFYCIKLVSRPGIVSNVYGLPLYLLHMIQAHSFGTCEAHHLFQIFCETCTFFWKFNSSVFFSRCAHIFV